MARYFQIYVVFAVFISSAIMALNGPPLELIGAQRDSRNETMFVLENYSPLEKSYESINTITKDDRFIFALFGIINNIVGFVSGALGIVDFFSGLFGGDGGGGGGGGGPTPKPPKYTIDEVMETMKSEFSIVKKALAGVYAVMDKQDVQSYANVEVAINGAMNDMKFNSSVQLDVRAVQLYDQVDFFLLGMLGKNTIGPDILKAVRGFTQCSDILKVISTYINMADLGLAGIAYYYIRLNKKQEGTARLDFLIVQRNDILHRVQSIEESCTKINATKVEQEVIKIIKKKPDSSIHDVSKALYAKFSDLYVDSIYWLFFVNKNFPLPNDIAAGWEGYDSNYQGKVIYQTWTVFWSGSPWVVDKINEPPSITINGPDIMKKALFNVDYVVTTNAYQVRRIYDKLWGAINGANLARHPRTVWVFVNTMDSTIGSPLVGPNYFFDKKVFSLRYGPTLKQIKGVGFYTAYFIIQ